MRLVGLAFILTLTLTLAPLGTAAAQPPEKVSQVGYINPGSPSDQLRQRRFEAFRQGLRELGYVERRNIAIDSRSADDKDDRHPTLAAGPVPLKVEAVVTL